MAHFGRAVNFYNDLRETYRNLSKIIGTLENQATYSRILLLEKYNLARVPTQSFGVQVRINEMKPLHLEIVRP